jgi:hypothetical protein
LKADDRGSVSGSTGTLASSLGESEMTRFQRVLLLSLACGAVAIGLAWLILVVLR